MAIAVPQNQHVNIRGFVFEAEPNAKAGNSYFSHVVDAQRDSGIVYRDFSILKKVTDLVIVILKEMQSASVAFYQELSGKLGIAAAALSIPRLPQVTSDAFSAIRNWAVVPTHFLADTCRDLNQKIHNVAEALAVYGYVGAFVSGDSSWCDWAQGPDVVAGATDIAISVQDMSLAKDGLETARRAGGANDALQTMFMDKMKHAFLLTVKSVCSVAGGIISLIALAFGGPILPQLPLILIGLAGAVSGLGAHFFKATAAYKLPDFVEVPRAVALPA